VGFAARQYTIRVCFRGFASRDNAAHVRNRRWIVWDYQALRTSAAPTFLFALAHLHRPVPSVIFPSEFMVERRMCLSCADALQPLLVLHAFRFIGLSFLVPGVVSPDLPIGFARGAAYGDIVAAILATLTTLRTSAGIAFAADSEAALHTKYLAAKEVVAIAGVIPQATPALPPYRVAWDSSEPG